LEFTLARLADNTPIDRALYGLVYPLGRLENFIGLAQDHFEATLHIIDVDARLQEPERRGVRALKWNELVRRAAQFAVNTVAARDKKSEVARRKMRFASAHLTTIAQTQSFVKTVAHAKEWTDLELLVRTFGELGAQPLLLSMPVEDIRLEVYGVSPAARTVYLRRLDQLAARYDVALLDFRDHEKDPAFLVDFLDHLSPQGWLYYNKALDDFYHGRED
jgi:D-alanine transfer protein